MSDLSLTKTSIHAGAYEGVLTASTSNQPDIAAYHLEREIGELSVTRANEGENCWTVRLLIPSDILTDGVQTFLINDKNTDETLDSFTIVTGEPLSDDLRGEIDLLRAELDMLKKAFRRHCIETTG